MNVAHIPFLVLLTCFQVSLFQVHAEVEKATVSWNPVMCTANCAKLIESKFSQLKEVEEVTQNVSQGKTTLKWNPNAPFSYLTIKRTMQMIGAGVDFIHLRVRGKIRAEGNKVVLYSTGDNTRFELVSAQMPSLSQPTVPANPALMKLDPRLRDTILADSDGNKTVVIEGPLYRPWNTAAMILIVQRMQVEKQKEDE